MESCDSTTRTKACRELSTVPPNFILISSYRLAYNFIFKSTYGKTVPLSSKKGRTNKKFIVLCKAIKMPTQFRNLPFATYKFQFD